MVPHAAVPVASALDSVVMALAVHTPPDTVPDVALNGSSASLVLPDRAVSGVAGCVPLYQRIRPLLPIEVAIPASRLALHTDEYFRLLAMVNLLS